MSQAVKVKLPVDSTAPAMARRAVDGLMGLPEPVAQDAKLLVSELVTNAIEHGRVGKDGAIELEVDVRGDALHVAVTDAGPGFVLDHSRRCACNRGYGLFFVERIADRWGVARDRSRVWFELDRRPTCDRRAFVQRRRA